MTECLFDLIWIQKSILNGNRIALSVDGNSNYPTVSTHALLRLNQNDKISTGASGSVYTSDFSLGGDRPQQQTFEGVLLKPN